MKSRGENDYIGMPVFAAKLYDNLTSVKGVGKGFEEIALFVTGQIDSGCLLDVGTGPGRLLCEINKVNKTIGLFGLDISESMRQVAQKNLQHIKNINLKVGNIIKTDYPDDFFDSVISTGSFYNWDKPVDGLNEIFRILKAGRSAFIFETTRDHDKILLQKRLKNNLKGYNLFRRYLSTYFLKRQLRMTYSNSEFDMLLNQSSFRNSYTITPVELGNLPIYLRIELQKTIS